MRAAQPGRRAAGQPGRVGGRRVGGRRAAGARPARRGVGRPRVDGAGHPDLHRVRPDRRAAFGQRGRWHVPALPAPAPGRGLQPLRPAQTPRRPHPGWAAAVWDLPPPPAGAPPVRAVRGHRLDRPPRPRRVPGRVRDLLPAAPGRLQRLRPAAAVQLRRHRHPDLQELRAPAGHHLCPLPAATPDRGPPTGRAGLRLLPHRRAATPPTVRRLRPDPPAGRPTRPASHHLRGLRRAPDHPPVHRLPDRGQAV